MRRTRRSRGMGHLDVLHYLFAAALHICPTISVPKPVPAAIPDPLPEPTALPDPLPNPEAIAAPEPQNGDYYAFSGAIYIVGPNGMQFSQAQPAMCPAGSQGCGNLEAWNWCCPEDCNCAWDQSHSVVGCCRRGVDCSGTPNRAQVTTMTVTVRVPVTTTAWQQAPITAAAAVKTPTQPVTGVFVASTESTTKRPLGGPYCTTVFMNGPGLPTDAPAPCGTGLIVNAAGPPAALNWRLIIGILGLHLLAFICGASVWNSGFSERGRSRR